MAEHDREGRLAVILVGMSAGSLDALKSLVCALPLDFRGSVVIARHVGANTRLPEIMNGWTDHPTSRAVHGTKLARGAIYICPWNRHITIEHGEHGDTLGVVDVKRANKFTRPSIDWLFETGAANYGDHAIVVLLSGSNDDGAVGAACVRSAHGHVIVQTPAECICAQMPNAAIVNGSAHSVRDGQHLGPAVIAQLDRLALSDAR